MQIQPCLPEQLDEIFQLLNDCKQALRADGIHQWTEHYPNWQIVADDIEKGTLFGLNHEGKCLGIVCLNTQEAEAYATVNWEDKDGKFLVVHRLAVSPQHREAGLGTQLMDFSEDFARKNGYTSVRLDTYSGNPRAQRLYEKRNYLKRGEVNFPERELPFYCYEKQLCLREPQA